MKRKLLKQINKNSTLLDKQRRKNNFRIIDCIVKFAKLHPELRFGQILYALEIIKDNIDLFNEESDVLWARIEKNKPKD